MWHWQRTKSIFFHTPPSSVTKHNNLLMVLRTFFYLAFACLSAMNRRLSAARQPATNSESIYGCCKILTENKRSIPKPGANRASVFDDRWGSAPADVMTATVPGADNLLLAKRYAWKRARLYWDILWLFGCVSDATNKQKIVSSTYGDTIYSGLEIPWRACC